MVSEWTYSILDGLERFMGEEPHFRLFKHVVLNECAEHAYYDEAEMLSALRIAIQNISTKAAKGPKQFVYTCQAEPLETLLRKFFPAKKTSDFTRIQRMILKLAKEHKDKIRDDVLFGAGRDLGKTEFMKLIRLQYVSEILQLLQALEDELRLRAKPGTDETKATIKVLKDAFHHVDRRKDKNDVIAWAETTLRSERNAEPLPASKGPHCAPFPQRRRAPHRHGSSLILLTGASIALLCCIIVLRALCEHHSNRRQNGVRYR